MQVWSTNALGGFMYSDNLSQKLRMAVQPMVRFRQFCDCKEALGYNKGDNFAWNVYSDVGTAGTTLTESDAMPETNFTITQASVTITEYGNSVPFTKKLDDLSEHPVTEVINQVLKNDARKALDTAAHAQFDATPLLAIGTSTSAVSFETDGSPSSTNDSALLKAHVKLIVDEMSERDIPLYDGEHYMCIGRPSTFRGFKDELESIHQYTDPGWRQIMNGEIGRYEGIRFIQQTNIASESWTNAKSDAAYFFGADTVCEAIACPEEIRGKIPTDYGRSKGIAWYALLGFGLVHTAQLQARVMKWDSDS